MLPRTGLLLTLAMGVCLSVGVAGESQAVAQQPAVSAPMVDRTDWERRLVGLNLQTWREALALGLQLADLAPNTGFEILRDNWSKLTSVPARQQMLKAFLFMLPAPFHPREHPRLLEVLHLGATDASPEVRKFTFTYLARVALRDFSRDETGYVAWYTEFGGRPLKEVAAASVERVLRSAAAARSVPDRLTVLAQIKLLTEQLTSAGGTVAANGTDRLLQVLGDWLAEPAPDVKVALSSLTAVGRLRLTPAFLRQSVLPFIHPRHPRELRRVATRLLGQPGNSWAYEPLRAALIRLVSGEYEVGELRLLSDAIVGTGDVRAVPTLIGIIAADDTPETRAEVNPALGKLTGIEANRSLDTAWWMNWWKKNRASLGETVRDAGIPDLQLKPDPAEADAIRRDARIAWIRDRSIPIRSIDPEDDDFADLMPLAARIGNARIVQLGEQSHGDGATFFAKTRLVRFLHEKMGFDVLAWESGLFDCNQMEQALHTERPLAEAIAEGVFPIWGKSAHVQPVFEYARKTHATSRPLEMAGFDCQFSTSASSRSFVRELRAVLAKSPHPGDEAPLIKVEELVSALASSAYKPPAELRAGYRDAVSQLLITLDKRGKQLEVHKRVFWERALENLLALEVIRAAPVSKDASSVNVRDLAMAENLLWMAKQRYPRRKIIVWAANFHIMRNAPEVEVLDRSLSYARTVPMGDTVWRKLGKRAYTIAFTAYSGHVGNPFFSSRRLPPASTGSLEWLCHHAGSSYALLDLRGAPKGHWLRKPLVARPLGYLDMRADWSRVFDAVLFTDRMFPSTSDGAVPTGVRTARSPGTHPEREAAARALKEFRRLMVTYGLTGSSTTAATLTVPDPQRLELYEGSTAWPSLVTDGAPSDPASYWVVDGRGRGYNPRQEGGFVISEPLTASLEPKTNQVLLFQAGIPANGGVISEGYTTLHTAGNVAGRLEFRGHAAAVIQGDLSGTLTAQSRFTGLVTGGLRGKYVAQTSSAFYILGGFSGEMELGSKAKVYIAGNTPEAALARLRGAGTLWLENSDLQPGEHVRGGVRIVVLGREPSKATGIASAP